MRRYVSEVRYAPGHTHIDQVRVRKAAVRKDLTTLGSAKAMTRQELVEALQNGAKVRTVFSESGVWRKGAKVRPIEIDGEVYVRTKADRTKADNLEDLPEF
jgi:hypothetical protein